MSSLMPSAHPLTPQGRANPFSMRAYQFICNIIIANFIAVIFIWLVISLSGLLVAQM